MTIYFITFIISFIFSVISQSLFKKNHKKTGYIFQIASILIPSILAGMRSINIGTDTGLYAKEDFFFALKYNSFYQYNKSVKRETLYCLINFIVSRFTDNLNISLFIFNFLALIFIYSSVKNINEKGSIVTSLSFLLYLLLFYNKSLNMIRQTISLALVIYNFKNIKERKFFKYIIIVVFSSLFHISSIISIIFYPLYILINSNLNYMIKMIIIVLTIFITLFFNQIVYLLINNLHFINPKYLYYIESNKVSVSYSYLLLLLFSLLLLLINRKALITIDSFNDYYIFILILGIILFSLSFRFNYMERLSYYFTYIIVLIIPKIYNVMKKNKNKELFIFLMIILGFSYSFIYYSIQGNDSTCPYKFYYIE